MKKSERIYYNIQEQGKKNVEAIASEILKYIEFYVGDVGFPSGLPAITKIYILLENGYYQEIQKVLDSFGYDYGVELQHLVRNIAYGELNSGFDSLRIFMKRFPSLNDMVRDPNRYCLDTRLGTICFEPLTRYSKDSKIKRFALQYENYKWCHVAALEFIKANPDYCAVTSLIAEQFGERHYHSYIETPDGYADFSNNIHLSKEHFDKLMRPEILNKVNGFDLEDQERQLTEEDLPDNKTLLLRLAVHNQIKKA